MKKIIVILSIVCTFILLGVLYDTLAQHDEVEFITTDYVNMNQSPDQKNILIYQLTEENIG